MKKTPLFIIFIIVFVDLLGFGIVIPILGARTVAQVQDTLGCLDHPLSGEQRRQLSELSPISLGFPHDFLASENVHNLTTGSTWAQIDNHHAT